MLFTGFCLSVFEPVQTKLIYPPFGVYGPHRTTISDDELPLRKWAKVSPDTSADFCCRVCSECWSEIPAFLSSRDLKKPHSSITWHFPGNFQQHPTESSLFMFNISCFVQPCQVYRTAVTVFSATFWTIDFILAFFVGYYVSGSLEPCTERQKNMLGDNTVMCGER